MEINKINHQKIAKIIGEYGCYFCSIVFLAENITGKKIDVIRAFEKYNEKKWIDDDCYINCPDQVLLDLLRENSLKSINAVTVRKETNTAYFPKNNEFLIGCFEWKTTMKTYSHFVNIDQNKAVMNDPLGSSNTVKNGLLKSLRVFTIL